MTLREWIAIAGLTQRAAAERLGVHEITLSRWLTGKAIPRRDQMTLIGSLTAGAVLPGSFYDASDDADVAPAEAACATHEPAIEERQ